MEAGGVAKPVTEPAETSRDWSELPGDAIASVFVKLGPVEILMGAGLVCRSWLDAAMVPYLWRSLDMVSSNTGIVEEKFGPAYEVVLRVMAKKAVDRSDGQLEVFIGERFVDDGLVKYIGRKAPSLKILSLLSCSRISTNGFVEAITSKFSLLEELELSACGGISGRATYEAVGKACQNIRRFKLVKTLCWSYNFGAEFVRGNCKDDDAYGIAAMHGLRYLMISGSRLNNKALTAILDNCSHLESLDLHSCFDIVMNDAIRAKCGSIKILVSPHDDNSSTDRFLLADGFKEYWNNLNDWDYEGAYCPSEYKEDNSDLCYADEFF